MSHYAVARGKIVGIFTTWGECKESVNDFKNPIFKKLKSYEEAETFISENKHKTHYREGKQNITLKTENKDIDKDVQIFNPDYFVYTDGSCINNGKKNARAGVGIYFGKNDKRNVSKKMDGKQTNNAAELTAIIQTYSIIEHDLMDEKRICIVSDSKYSIHCSTKYGEKMEKGNWESEIPNKALVRKSYELYKNQNNVRFIHIMAHTENTDIHSEGNKNADLLAVAGANI
jgi:ribonuclease HI